LLAQTAKAQTAEVSAASPEGAATVEARALFREAAQWARAGDWSQALAAFERSRALRPHAVTTYNIGYCERALGRAVRARNALRNALAENAAHGGGELPEALATAATQYLLELERRVARAIVRLSPEDSSILVDGRPLEVQRTDGPRPVLLAGTRDAGPGEPVAASTFELQLDPGAHVFVVSRAGYADDVTTRTFEPGSELDITVTLAPPPESRAPSASYVRESAGSATRSPGRLPQYVALGVGGAGLMTGAIAGGIALAQAAKVHDTCGANHACTGAGSTYLTRADIAADVATAGFIAAGLCVAVAVTIGWLSPKRVTAERHLRLAPWVTPGAGGVYGIF
jgi:hypothetical protein